MVSRMKFIRRKDVWGGGGRTEESKGGISFAGIWAWGGGLAQQKNSEGKSTKGEKSTKKKYYTRPGIDLGTTNQNLGRGKSINSTKKK